jgi:hypothetical protein
LGSNSDSDSEDETGSEYLEDTIDEDGIIPTNTTRKPEEISTGFDGDEISMKTESRSRKKQKKKRKEKEVKERNGKSKKRQKKRRNERSSTDQESSPDKGKRKEVIKPNQKGRRDKGKEKEVLKPTSRSAREKRRNKRHRSHEPEKMGRRGTDVQNREKSGEERKKRSDKEVERNVSIIREIKRVHDKPESGEKTQSPETVGKSERRKSARHDGREKSTRKGQKRWRKVWAAICSPFSCFFPEEEAINNDCTMYGTAGNLERMCMEYGSTALEHGN